MIEEAALPDGIFAYRPHNSFSDAGLEEPEPPGEIELGFATDEERNVIRHDHISTDGNIVLGIGTLAKCHEGVVHYARSEVGSFSVRAECDEIERVGGEDKLESSWRSGEAHAAL